MTNEDFLEILLSTNGPHVGSLQERYDMDHVQEWIDAASVAPFASLQYDTKSGNFSYRKSIRALAAVLFDKSLSEAAHRAHRMLSNPDLSVADVQEILRGSKAEIPFATLQAIGRALTNGDKIAAIKNNLSVDKETILSIDRILGIRQAREDRLIGLAITEMDDNTWSQRTFARRYNLTEWEARTVGKTARSVRLELAG